MGAITNLDDAINKLTGGNSGNPETLWWMKTPRIGAAAITAPVVSRYASLWRYNGNPCAGAAPGATARNPTRTTNGALGQVNATGGRTKYLTGWAMMSRIQMNTFLYDRLADISGLSGTVTTEQTFAGLSVTRYTGAESVGNSIWIEIYTSVGTTGTTIKAKYTNQAGTSGQVTPLIGFGAAGDLEAERLLRLPLASGDTGVRSVESVTVTATTGTAGDFGVSIYRQLAMNTMPYDGTWGILDLITGKPGPVVIKDDACLSMLMVLRSGTGPDLNTVFQFVEA